MKVKQLIYVIIAIMGVLLMSGCAKQPNEQLTTFEEYYAEKVADFASENQNYEPGAVDVVFLGDSLTDFMDEQKFYPQYVALNRGIGGDTTTGLEARLQVSLFDVQPKVAVMLIGINNLATMFENYETLLQKIHAGAPQTKMVLLSLSPVSPPWPASNAQIALNNVRIKQLGEKYGDTYLDIFTALYDAENDKLKAEYTIDGGHFSATGYSVISRIVTPELAKLLGK